MTTVDDLRAEATGAAELGDLASALGLFRRLVDMEPAVAENHSDLVVVLYSLRKLDEARRSLERATELDAQSAEALWNLAEVCLDQGDYRAADDVMDRLEALSLLTTDLVNRTASVAVDAGDKRAGLELVLRSLDMDAAQPGLSDMATVLNLGKLAVFCQNDDRKFLGDIVNHLSRRFIVREYKDGGEDEIFQLLQWCDLAFFEWCGPLLVVASGMPKVAKIVCRLHRYEAYRPWPAQVDWANVDVLITLGNPYVMEALRTRAGDIERKTRIVTVPNGINLTDFPFNERARGKNLACLGYLNMRKNPMLLLQCFRDLLARDDGYHLFFAGNFQDDMLQQYMIHMVGQLGLADKVHFDGWRDDVDAWLQDKHFLVSSTIGEGHPVGVMEGMARGLKPVIHDFPGAGDYYPDEYLWRTSEEFVRRISDDPYRPAEYRAFVEERYPLSNQLQAFAEVFADLAGPTHTVEVSAPAPTATQKWRDRLRPFCVGSGLHIGAAADRITEDATPIEGESDAANLSCAEGSQDFVYAGDALCRVSDPVYAIGQWLRALRPGGRLAFALPHAWPARDGVPAFRPAEIANAVAVHTDAKTIYLDEGDGNDFALVVEKTESEVTGEDVLIECNGDLRAVLCLESAVRAFGLANAGARITLRTPFPELFRPHEVVRRSIHVDAAPHDTVSYSRTLRVAYADQPDLRTVHLVERAGAELGIAPFEDRCPVVRPDRFDKVIARKFALGDGLKIAVAPGAKQAFLCWDYERFGALCDLLSERLSARIVQFGRAGDEALPGVINLIGRAGAREEASAMRQCDLAICVDNGYAHLAAAVGIPRVVIFGPSHPEARMHAGCAVAVRSGAECCACLSGEEPRRIPRFCAKGTHECMRSITVEQVVSAVAELCTAADRSELAGALAGA